MKPGAKPKPMMEIVAAGTYEKARHQFRGEVIVPGDPPMMPDYLTPEAQLVWQEEIGRVMQVGVGDCDSSLFARYCCTEALARETFRSGDAVPSTILTALRQMAELLRIAGPSSRVGVKADGAKPANAFARLARS